jgi:hypothetical protein
MILVPLFDLKFLYELAAGAVGTSNRRHERFSAFENKSLPLRDWSCLIQLKTL